MDKGRPKGQEIDIKIDFHAGPCTIGDDITPIFCFFFADTSSTHHHPPSAMLAISKLGK